MKAKELAIFGGPAAVESDLPSYRSLGPEEVEAARLVIEGGTLSDFIGAWDDKFLGGSQVKSLEIEWAEAFECQFAVSVNSATSGLIAAVGACGIGPGDEVIVSPFTMTSSASCVRVMGGTPVFADIDPDTFNISPRSIERCITAKTRAIIPVDLAGQAADMDEIMALADSHNLFVIEDAAQAPGAKYKGRWAGTLGHIGIFSLNCHKTINSGEGGLCCTNNPELATRLQLIRNHGEAVVEDMGYSDRPERILGFNFRLGEIEAAIAREQLKKLRELTEPRIAIARRFDARLSKLKGLQIPKVGDDRTHVYYTYMMRVDERNAGVTRKQIVTALAAEGVICREGYARPLYLQPLYKADWPGKNGREYGNGLCPVAEAMFDDELFFHTYLHDGLEDHQVEQIISGFEKVWSRRSQLKGMD